MWINCDLLECLEEENLLLLGLVIVVHIVQWSLDLVGTLTPHHVLDHIGGKVGLHLIHLLLYVLELLILA